MIGSIEDEASMMNINQVVDAIDHVTRPIPSYTFLKEELQKNGLSPALSNWLSTSVRLIICFGFIVEED